jgi:hypothetical protein
MRVRDDATNSSVVCWIRGSHIGDYEEQDLLGYNAM